MNIEKGPIINHPVVLEYYTGTRAVPLNSLESHCFLYLMMTVGLGTALGVTTLLVSIYCICTCRRRGNKSVPIASSRAAQSPTAPAATALETLMIEACYPEVLDALSRSVRQKKQNVHDEIIKIYGAAAVAATKSAEPTTTLAVGNVYSSEPRPSVKQIKRHRQQLQQDRVTNQNVTTVTVGPPERRERNNDALYWEIGQHQILPPTSV